MAGILVGATTTGLLGGTAATEQAALEAIVGKQSIRRCYGGSSYTTSPYFMQSYLGAVDVDTTHQVSIRTTHVSWDPDCTSLCSENPSGFNPTNLLTYLAAGQTGSALSAYGTETQANLKWLLSAPVYAQVIWTPWHEADGNYLTGSPDYNYTSFAAFQLGFKIVADMVHTIANFYSAPWQTCLVLESFAWKGNSGTNEDPDNFWPGNGYVDIVGIDAYNEGSLTAARWDSLQASLGYPADSNEATAYQTRYGGTGGHKTSDAAGTWANGFLGWCEARGVTQWLIAEFGTIRNIDGLSPTWVGGVGSKAQWITDGFAFIESYNADPTKNAKCVAVEYFYRGRQYSGSDYLANTIHLVPSGTRQVCMGTITTAQLTTLLSGNTTGDLRWNSTAGHVYRWSGTAWTDQGAAADESWELFWNEDGSGIHGGNSAESAWATVTTSQAAGIRLGAVILSATVDSALAALTAPVHLGAAATTTSTLGAGLTAAVRLAATALTTVSGSSGLSAPVTLLAQVGGPISASIRLGAVQISSSVQHPAGNLFAAVTLGAGAQGTAAAGGGLAAPVALGVSNAVGPAVIRIGAVRIVTTDGVKIWNGVTWVDNLLAATLAAPVALGAAATTIAEVSSAAGLVAPITLVAGATVTIPPNPLSVVLALPVSLGAGAPLVTQAGGGGLSLPVALIAMITEVTGPSQDIPFSLWDGTQEIALTIAGLWDGTEIQPLSLSWLS